MKKSHIYMPALGLLLGASMFTSSADAFWRGAPGQGMTEDRFQLMREYFVNNDYEGLVEAMKTWKEERIGEREQRQESIQRSVENIDNGVIMTVTSDDEDVVTHLQSKERPEPRHEGVLRTVENIENGVRITVTSNDPETVERIQNRHENEGWGHGRRGQGIHKGHGRGMQGEQWGGRSGQGQGMGRGMNRGSWNNQ